MPKKQDTPKIPRERHIPARLQLNDASCHPGPELLDRLACRHPDPEALAIQSAWKFRFPVTVMPRIED